MPTCNDILVSNWENDISQAKTLFHMVLRLCDVLQFEKSESKEIVTCTNYSCSSICMKVRVKESGRDSSYNLRCGNL